MDRNQENFKENLGMFQCRIQSSTAISLVWANVRTPSLEDIKYCYKRILIDT